MLFQSVTMDFPPHFRYALKLFKHVCALLLSFTRLLHFCIAEPCYRVYVGIDCILFFVEKRYKEKRFKK